MTIIYATSDASLLRHTSSGVIETSVALVPDTANPYLGLAGQEKISK